MKKLSYLFIGIAILFGIGFYFFNTRTNNIPKVFAGVIIEEHDGMVPLLLDSIEDWDYDKNKLSLEIHLITGSNDVKDTVERWVQSNRGSYAALGLIDDRYLTERNTSRIEVNRVLGQIKDGMMISSKEQNCAYCFITSSNTLLRPYTLSYLVEQKKPIIAPMLFTIPKLGDPFRNFFAAVTEHGYYKDDPQYLPIATRSIKGTFELPCVHMAYLIDTATIDALSFSKDFTDWEFLSFSKRARRNGIGQFLSNEKEFGFFLLLDDKLTQDQRTSYSPFNHSTQLTEERINEAIEPYLKQAPSLKKAADAFARRHHLMINLPDESLLVVDDIHNAINTYILRQGFASEALINQQFSKYASPGSETVIIGNRSEADPIILSGIVGDKGKVHLWESDDHAFIRHAINKEMNSRKNISLNKASTIEKSRLDDVPLTNLSLIVIDSNGSEVSALRGALNTIEKHKPVIMVSLADDEDLTKNIEEILSLGYIYTLIGEDLYLFFPLTMAGLDLEEAGDAPLLPPVAALLDKEIPPFSEDGSPIKVTWDGTFLDFGSLSHVNRALTAEVLKYPMIDLTAIEHHQHHLNAQKFEELKETAKRLKANSPADTEITVRHMWPPNWKKPASDKWVLIQPWEFGFLPREWVKEINNIDEVWIPSNYVKKVYTDSGISPDKVFVVPNGFNPEVFNEQAAPYPLPTKKSFKFLFLGGAIHRKGADILLNSYLQTFDDTDDVCLVIKDFGTKGGYSHLTIADYIKQAQKRPGAPEIFYIDDDMDVDQIAGIYTACDCLVYPYRGEGFAMPVLEAMASGIPVIVTDGGATDDFVSRSFGWKIPSKRIPISNYTAGFELSGEGWMLEADGEILSGMMRWVYEHQDLAKKKGSAGAKFAKEYMTWDNIAPIVVERLEALRQP